MLSAHSEKLKNFEHIAGKINISQDLDCKYKINTGIGFKWLLTWIIHVEPEKVKFSDQ